MKDTRRTMVKPKLDGTINDCYYWASHGTETSHQKAVMAWSAIAACTDWRYGLLVAYPVGGKRNKLTAGRMKAEGARKGYPDLIFAVPTKRYPALFIEMKLEKYRNHKNGGCSDDQIFWHKLLHRAGNCVIVCYSWIEATHALTNYMSNKLESNLSWITTK